VADLDLTDVLEHLSIAFGGLYEKLAERSVEIQRLEQAVAHQRGELDALSNRIESVHRGLSERIEHATDVAAGRDAR
jgi:hypothetical protein